MSWNRAGSLGDPPPASRRIAVDSAESRPGAAAATGGPRLRPDLTAGVGGESGGRRQALPSPTARLDLNSASAAELELLPGIGPALAGRIVEHRTKNGRFRSVADLDSVRGVGPRILERVRGFVFVDSEADVTPEQSPGAPADAPEPATR